MFRTFEYVQLNHETKMVTYFNRKDLVKFGNYLLSEERTNLVTQHEGMTKEMQEEALKQVSDADVSNWLDYMLNEQESI